MTANLPQGQLISPNQDKKNRLLLSDSPEELRQKFYELKTPLDVAKLLNIPHKRLVYHLYLVDSQRRYKTFTIPKKSGGERQISTPITALKIIQQKLNQVLQAVYQVKPSVHGFVQDKNIVTNAKAHVKKRYILNLDLEDFFPSVNFGRVRGMFMAIPYHLQTTGNHQEVTGLTTNQFPNVDRRFVRQVRAMLHAWAKFGLESAQKEFEEKYHHKARFLGKQTPHFQDVLKGKIEFIGMVKGKDEGIYQKYLDQYYQLLKIYL